MAKNPKKKRLDAPMAWAWELKNGHLCRWARASQKQLEDENSKPEPGAKPVRVRLVPAAVYRKLTALLKLLETHQV